MDAAALDAKAVAAADPAKARMPHRWQVVMLMALSFVLCNMDKASVGRARVGMGFLA